MSDNLSILCPGQGAQHVGMAQAWAQASPAAKATFDAADAIFGAASSGASLSEVCFNGPEETVHRTNYAQPAIYTASIASIRGLVETNELNLDDVTAVAGLSLGEYTALHLAGVFSFEDGLNLVIKRGRFMQEAAEASDSSMVALIGADEDQANALCDAARAGDILVPANFNCPGQIVISGSTAACQRSLDEAEKLGLRATALSVAGAFHSPFMDPAAARMREALDAVEFQSPALPVLSNVTGQPHSQDTSEIKDRLVQQITGAVRWEQNVRWLLENKPGRFIEPAPGKVLSGLMRRIDRKTKVQNHANPAK